MIETLSACFTMCIYVHYVGHFVLYNDLPVLVVVLYCSSKSSIAEVKFKGWKMVKIIRKE